MSHTEPLTGARIPDGTDNTQIWNYWQWAVGDLADNTIPRFTNTTTRDAAYSTWVAGGGAMQSGLTCHTTADGRYWWYNGTAWQYLAGNPPAMLVFPGNAGWGVAGTGSYSPPKYYKDGNGIVHGQGVVVRTGGSATNPTMGTLPVGYRPLTYVESVTLGVTGAGSLATYQAEVGTDGVITVIGTVTTSTNFFLNGLSFNPNN